MSFLLNSQDFKDQKITDLLMKKVMINEAPLSSKTSSKLMDTNDIGKYINRSKKKKCTICPMNSSLSSSVQSTLNTLHSMTFKNNSQFKKFFKDLSLNSTSNLTERVKTSNKLLRPKTGDMKMLYKIFFNYTIEPNLTLAKINEKYDYKNKKKGKKSKYDLKTLRNYLIKSQMEFNEGGDILIKKTDQNIPLINCYIMTKLENLIARYFLTIFLFIKSKDLIEAKIIFLLMIKENIRFFNYMENKICTNLKTRDKNNFQSKDSYHMIYQLIKIYSVIIRYSLLFNIMKYRNKFMGRYFRLISLNYFFFMHLVECHGFNNEMKNQIISWLSFYISYVNYFSISNYSSFSIPLTLNNILLSLYKNCDENVFLLKEKKLFLNTQYNQGLLLFIKNKKDEALFILKQEEQKMKILDNKIRYNQKDFISSLNKSGVSSSNSSLKNVPYFEIKEKKKKASFKSSKPIQLWKKAKMKEYNGNINEKEFELIKSVKYTKSRYSIYEDIENICKNFIQSNVVLSDVIQLIQYGIDKGKIQTKDIYDLDKAVFSHFQKSESTTLENTLRNSQIVTSKSKNIELYFPKYLMDPLFFKIELLIEEILINKKDIKSAYNQVLKILFLFILLKYFKYGKYYYKNMKTQKLLNEYLNKIDELCDEQLKLDSNQSESESQFFSNGLEFINVNDDVVEEKTKNKNEITIIKEFEKFFIFLSSLSIYQIKILNETQPENEKRNDLPIFFSCQFKDCLSTLQRIQLYELQTMALSRFIILKNPNKWIIPSNLNISLLDSTHHNYSINNNNKFSMNYLTNIRNMQKYSLSNFKSEYNNYKKILISKKVTSEMKDFLNRNIDLSLKILSKSTGEELKYIMNDPSLLIEPIKKYKKKSAIEVGKENGNVVFLYNYKFHNSNNNITKFVLRDSKEGDRISFHSRLSNDIFQKVWIEKKSSSSRLRRRNKSTGNIEINQNFIDNMNQCYFLNDVNGTKDYNDSYEDYKLSVDYSFDDNNNKV